MADKVTEIGGIIPPDVTRLIAGLQKYSRDLYNCKIKKDGGIWSITVEKETAIADFKFCLHLTDDEERIRCYALSGLDNYEGDIYKVRLKDDVLKLLLLTTLAAIYRKNNYEKKKISSGIMRRIDEYLETIYAVNFRTYEEVTKEKLNELLEQYRKKCKAANVILTEIKTWPAANGEITEYDLVY